jgi:hypothetical protein
VGALGQLFDGCCEILQGLSMFLGPRLQLAAVCGGQVLVSKVVFQGLYAAGEFSFGSVLGLAVLI